ncbi:EH domain-containing protein 1, partial [Tanacetum coccineum]
GGPDERSVPGNTIAVQADMPFHALTTFGGAFLSKFECSQMPHPLLEHITFVDTPVVLSGEKQHTERSYDFIGVIKWFAEKCDMILLLFDPHKLDISDEFKRVMLDRNCKSLVGQERSKDTKDCWFNNKWNKVAHLSGPAQGDQEAVKECYKEYIGMVKIYYEGAQRSKQGRPGEDVVGNSSGTALIKEP